MLLRWGSLCRARILLCLPLYPSDILYLAAFPERLHKSFPALPADRVRWFLSHMSRAIRLPHSVLPRSCNYTTAAGIASRARLFRTAGLSVQSGTTRGGAKAAVLFACREARSRGLMRRADSSGAPTHSTKLRPITLLARLADPNAAIEQLRSPVILPSGLDRCLP